jgi:hypothetical protein
MLGHRDMLAEAAAIGKARRNETMTKFGKVFLTPVLAVPTVCVGVASDKKDFTERYKDKYFVVMRDGLVLAICSERPGHESYIRVEVSVSGAEIAMKGFRAGGYWAKECGATAEPVHKGEVLTSSKHAGASGNWLEISVKSLSPHAVTRGVGAFQHESYEYPAAVLVFPLEGGNDQAEALVDKWLKTFDTQEEAAKFGNTASGAFVKEVKLGMTPAEDEAALGLPETKVDLGEKVLYKYKNMTVEFHGGKVTDVR